LTGLRLYLFTCGSLLFDPSVFLPDQPRGEKVRGPIPFYLLEHPKGRVLVDTGCHPIVADNPEMAWGSLTRVFYPEIRHEDLVPEQLRRIGIDTDTIDTVVCTHLHMDHAGGNSLFPKARFLVHSREWEAVKNPSLEGKGYFRNDWDHPLNYISVEDGHDLFGDATVILRALPGHSPGHMGLILKLERAGTVVLGIDAAPMLRNIHGPLPRNVVDSEMARRSVDILRSLKDQNARIICGHDPDQWSTLPLAPAYLD
jgi:N-acyl homoserine lactone hydrolase